MGEKTQDRASNQSRRKEEDPLMMEDDDYRTKLPARVPALLLQLATERTSLLRDLRNQSREGQEIQVKLIDEVDSSWLTLKEILIVWRLDDMLEIEERNVLRKYSLACLQFFANVSSGNAVTSGLIWKIFFPDRFLELLETFSRDRDLLMCTCVSINNYLACSIDKVQAVNDLLSSGALICKLLRIVLPPLPSTSSSKSDSQTQNQMDPCFEWIYLMIIKILEAKKGREAFEVAGIRRSSQMEVSQDCIFTPEQLVLLHLYEDSLGDPYINGEHAEGSNKHNILLMDGGELLIEIIERVKKTITPLEEGEIRQTPELLVAQEAGIVLVRILGGVLASDDLGSLRDVLVEAGVAQLLVNLLVKEGGKADGSIPLAADAPDENREGRKGAIIRAIGNLCHGCRKAQDAVREEGGIPMILSHCNVDSSNPFLREWSLLAVRNLCADNLENQKAIEELKPQETVTNASLRSMGIDPSLSLDSEGKPRVTLKINRPPK